MKRISFILLLTVFFALIPTPASAFTDWRCLKTEHFTVFYPPGFGEQAKEVLQTLEYHRPEVERLTGNRRLHLPVVISDLGINANGSANPLFIQIQLFWYPPKTELMGAVEDWNTLVAIHEYTHILQMTNVGKGPKVLCGLFGSIFYPNCIVPGWVIEGITVYSESRLWNYQGRLNDGEYEAYVAARAREGRFPSIIDATFEPHEFHLDGIYTYGGVFFNYLAKEYGEEKFAEFFTVQGSSWASIDENAQAVFGKSFPKLWEEWQAYETKRFRDFHIDGEQVTKDGWRVGYPLLVEGGDGVRRLYYQKTRPVKINADKVYYYREIIERNLGSGEEKAIVSTTSSFSLPLKVFEDKLYYGVYEQKSGYANTVNQGYGWGALLRQRNLSSGKDRLVLSGEIRAYDLTPDGGILYAEAKRDGFGARLYLYTPQEGSRLLYDLDYLIDEILVDGERVFLVARENKSNTDLYLFSLGAGELKPLIATPYVESGLSVVGEKLFFHANYDRVYSAYCYDLSENKVYRMTGGGYAVYPLFDEKEGDLFFIGLNSFGFDLYRKEAVFNEYQAPEAGPEFWPELSLEGMEIKEGGYWENLKTLTPKIMLPSYFEEQGRREVGLFFIGSDAVGDIPVYTLGINYDLHRKQLGADAVIQLNLLPRTGMLFGYSSREKRPFYLEVDYPLISRISPGISRFALGSSLNYGDDQGVEVAPYLSLGLQYPGVRANLKLQTPMEYKSWGGVQERVGYYGELSVEQNCFQGELLLKANGIYDPENQDQVFPRIRGYKEALTAKKGGVYTVEYAQPLLPVRKGSWLLGMCLGDLCSALFVDVAIPQVGDYQLSYGFELYQEVILSVGPMRLTINPGMGMGFDREGRFFAHLMFKGGLL